jgi:NAD(P)-dependent dehydrogenase (short-subunit alcohol dehydrogenase family)
MRVSVIVALAVLACGGISAQAEIPATNKGKVILVTGASTGIGRSIVERLAAKGYVVYATARKDKDLAALDAIPNVKAIRLDITKPEDIKAAREVVEHEGRGLYGLVNNAGITSLGLIMANTTTEEEFDLVMRTNVYGTWRMVRAFGPMVKDSHGRIVNMGSIEGIVPSPGYATYCMTKHAIEAFTDALADEIKSSGVSVSIVEPGSYKTDILKNQVDRINQGQSDAKWLLQAKDPAEVAEATENALFEAKPKRRYLVAPNEQESRFAIEGHIQRLADLNERQPYTYSRKQLVAMLDKALNNVKRGTRPSSDWPGVDEPPTPQK